MAKQQISYLCEICGGVFQKEKQAQECELQHFKVVEIKGIAYDKKESKKEFPLKVNLRLKNDKGNEKIISYYRKES